MVSSSFYYRSKPKLIDSEQGKLDAAMKHVHADMDATYGKRRMLTELQAMGLSIHKVRTSMRRLKLVAKRPKQHRYQMEGTVSVIAPNHLI